MSMLPPNATLLERAVELLAGSRIDTLGAPLRQLWSPEDCPVALLPWLAWALSIDNWDPQWPVHVRRARISAALAVQRRKGTSASVHEVVASLGGTIALTEWWQMDPPGDPHTFDLLVSLPTLAGAVPSTSFIDSVSAEVRATKPLRSHFTFTVAQSARARIGLRAVGRAATFASLGLVASTSEPLPGSALTLGAAPLTLRGHYLTIGA